MRPFHMCPARVNGESNFLMFLSGLTAQNIAKAASLKPLDADNKFLCLCLYGWEWIWLTSLSPALLLLDDNAVLVTQLVGWNIRSSLLAMGSDQWRSQPDNLVPLCKF